MFWHRSANQTLDRNDKHGLWIAADAAASSTGGDQGFRSGGATENFTAAAAELGMTQAAVSYQVKSLEERLGAPLFVRERGRARLTPLGAKLLPALSSAFNSIEAAFATHREEDEIAPVDHHHAYLCRYLAGVAARRVSDGASRPCRANDDQQRDVRPSRRRRRCRRSRPAAAVGRAWRRNGCSNRPSPR